MFFDPACEPEGASPDAGPGKVGCWGRPSFTPAVQAVNAASSRWMLLGLQHAIVENADLQVDCQRSQVFRQGIPIALSAREFELSAYFIEHRGEVVRRVELLEQVWSYRGVSNTRTVDMYVAKLPKKIEDEPAKPRWIAIQHGVGYRFEG